MELKSIPLSLIVYDFWKKSIYFLEPSFFISKMKQSSKYEITTLQV